MNKILIIIVTLFFFFSNIHAEQVEKVVIDGNKRVSETESEQRAHGAIRR